MRIVRSAKPVSPRPTARLWVGAAISSAALLTAGLAAVVPAAAAPAPPVVLPAAAAAQCGIGLGAPSSGDAAAAASVLAGRVNLGRYGSFTLTANPSWRSVRTLDSSGNGHMHSLHYLLPLLRDGVRRNDHAMVARFYALLADWVKDNPARPNGAAWNVEIVEGYRALTLVCAAAGPQGQAPWLRAALVAHAAWFLKPGNYDGVNNASLHQSMGLLAIGAALGRADWQRVALARIGVLGSRLVRSDGSDGEGAPAYAIDNYQWLAQAAERVTRAGLPVPASLAGVSKVPAFVAQATRPDFRLEALGDSLPTTLTPGLWAGTDAEWSASAGASGTAPASTFATYSGGYVFGRSGWGQARAATDETFYSVRYGRRSGLPHAHDDAGSLTLSAQGGSLLQDIGQWRYQDGVTRAFVVGRSAHNVVLVDGVARSSVPAPELLAASTGPVDVVTVRDRAYRGVTLTRTVAYDRAHDVVVVWDALASASPVRASQQWNLTRGRSVALGTDVATSAGPGPNLAVLLTGGSEGLDAVRGARRPMRGWSSLAYGELAPAPSVRSTQVGSRLSWVTVLAPVAAGQSTASSAVSQVSTDAATVAVTLPGGDPFTVALTRTSASVTDGATALTPSVRLGSAAAQPGAPVALRFSGVTPGARARVEALGADGWSEVGSVTAGPAGTGRTVVASDASTSFRVSTTDGVASEPVPLAVGLPPSAPASVSAAISIVGTGAASRGKVTVRWAAPAQGPRELPVSGYTVRIGGRSVTVPAGTRAARFTGLRLGRMPATVVARNVVGTSPAAAVSVKVTR